VFEIAEDIVLVEVARLEGEKNKAVIDLICLN
jgi:hypothetical protein